MPVVAWMRKGRVREPLSETLVSLPPKLTYNFVITKLCQSGGRGGGGG